MVLRCVPPSLICAMYSSCVTKYHYCQSSPYMWNKTQFNQLTVWLKSRFLHILAINSKKVLFENCTHNDSLVRLAGCHAYKNKKSVPNFTDLV